MKINFYRMRILLILALLGFTTASLHAAGNAYYIPNGSIKECLKEQIEYARNRIDLCIHDFAAIGIVEYIEAANKRGVKTHVVIVDSGSGARGILAETLINKGFDVRILKPTKSDKLAHDFVVFDDRVLAIGVYNWLAYSDRSVCGDVIFHQDQNKVRNYKDTFCRLFAEGEPIPFANNQTETSVSRNIVTSGKGPIGTPANAAKQGFMANRKPMVEEKPVVAATKALVKEFIDMSMDELDEKLGKESTLSRSEKNKLWKKIKGKYVRWQGFIIYRGMSRVDWNRVGVSRQHSKYAEVEIIFDWHLFDKVTELQIGSILTYTGKLASRAGYNSPYRLYDGNIE